MQQAELAQKDTTDTTVASSSASADPADWRSVRRAMEDRNLKFGLNDFDMDESVIVGKGSYGLVRRVKLKASGAYPASLSGVPLAMKVAAPSTFVTREVRALEACDHHPFIVGYVCCFSGIEADDGGAARGKINTYLITEFSQWRGALQPGETEAPLSFHDRPFLHRGDHPRAGIFA